MKLRKNFDRCPHKDVKYSYGRGDVTYILGADLTCPKTEETETPVAITANSMVNKTSGKSPRRLTVDGHYRRPGFGEAPSMEYTFKTQKWARSWLGKVAAQTICEDCTYAKSTPEEVETLQFDALQHRLKEAQQAATKAAIEIDITQATTAANIELLDVDLAAGISPSLNLSPETN